MNVLFLHFPKDNSQIESLGLPKYFSRRGHFSYLAFEKQHRNFFCKISKDTTVDLRKEELFNIKYDIIVGKSSAFVRGVYDDRYFKGSPAAFKINITPMGISANRSGVDYCFKEDQLIKPPPDDMQQVFKQYSEYKNRENIIFIPASIGVIKNQLEFINLVNPGIISDYTLLFAGPIKSRTYFNKMSSRMKDKNIKYEYVGHIEKKEIAKIMKRAKIVSLTTDPRPAQPYDPGPRVIPEAVCAGTPFFVNDLVLFPSCLRKCGFVYDNGDIGSFNEVLEKMTKFDLNKISRASFAIGREKLTMNSGCEVAYEDILTAYEEFGNQ